MVFELESQRATNLSGITGEQTTKYSLSERQNKWTTVQRERVHQISGNLQVAVSVTQATGFITSG